MMRFMNSSNIGTVKAVSPWFGRQCLPNDVGHGCDSAA